MQCCLCRSDLGCMWCCLSCFNLGCVWCWMWAWAPARVGWSWHASLPPYAHMQLEPNMVITLEPGWVLCQSVVRLKHHMGPKAAQPRPHAGQKLCGQKAMGLMDEQCSCPVFALNAETHTAACWVFVWAVVLKAVQLVNYRVGSLIRPMRLKSMVFWLPACNSSSGLMPHSSWPVVLRVLGHYFLRETIMCARQLIVQPRTNKKREDTHAHSDWKWQEMPDAAYGNFYSNYFTTQCLVCTTMLCPPTNDECSWRRLQDLLQITYIAVQVLLQPLASTARFWGEPSWDIGSRCRELLRR